MRDANTAALMRKYRPLPLVIPWCDRHDDIAAWHALGVHYCRRCFTEACGYAEHQQAKEQAKERERMETYVAPRVTRFRPDPLQPMVMRHYAHRLRGVYDDPYCDICIGLMA